MAVLWSEKHQAPGGAHHGGLVMDLPVVCPEVPSQSDEDSRQNSQDLPSIHKGTTPIMLP